MIRTLNESHKVKRFLYGAVFLFMLLCNMLTTLVSDDFQYCFSFVDDTRIEHVSQIIPSMMAHAHTMNGRLVAHSMVQLLAMLPLVVFDGINALVYTLQIALIEKVSSTGKRNNLIPLLAFFVIWWLEPAFGQVNLWQDGAVNYLWSIVAALLFLLPYINAYLCGKKITGICGKTAYPILCFVMGAFSETVSAAAVFMAMLLVALAYFHKKQKPDFYQILCIGIAFLGYVSIYLAPAQWSNKSASLSVSELLGNFADAVKMYRTFAGLLVSFAVMLVWCILEKADRKRLYLAGVFLLGSLAANFIMVLAGYYPERCACGAFVFLVAANGILAAWLLENQSYRAAVATVSAALVISLIPNLLLNTYRIGREYRAIQANHDYIVSCAEQGIMDIEVPMIITYSKYSALYDGKYLDTEDATVWPNNVMAWYYGVNSISAE